MEQAKLNKIIEQARLDRSTSLDLRDRRIASLPESIGNLVNLIYLYLEGNQLTNLPESIGNLVDLSHLGLGINHLTSLPESIGNLCIGGLNLRENQLKILPDSIGNLSNLHSIQLCDTLKDLSILQDLPSLKAEEDLPSLLQGSRSFQAVSFMDVELPRRYWTKLSEWKSEWLLDENNAEVRRALIAQIGYEKICHELNAVTVNTWREYTLLKIDRVEKVYNNSDKPIDREPMVLLKMTCPSTGHIHILRVPPEMTSAEAAITWINHGIHPDKFAVQT